MTVRTITLIVTIAVLCLSAIFLVFSDENGFVHILEKLPRSAPPTVSSPEEADRLLNKTVAVIGKARGGKAGWFRVSPDFYVECEGAGQTNLIATGRQVRIIGKLMRRNLHDTNQFNDGTIVYAVTNSRIVPIE